MPNTNTKIKVKRSIKNFNDLKNKQEPLSYGEPLFLKSDDSFTYNDILAIGNPSDAKNQDEDISKATIFEGHDINYVGKAVYFNEDNNIVDKNGNLIGTAIINAQRQIADKNNDKKYFLVSIDKSDNHAYYHADEADQLGVFITGNGVMHGAAWNDYAEKRICIDDVKPGQVVCENGDGTLSLSNKKLQKVPYIVSDTFGIIIGEDSDNYIPVAVAGRVLTYVDKKVEVGDVLCAGENGFATPMSPNEVVYFPDRILGVVSEIPDYDTWNNKVDVDNRVWVKIK